MDTIFFSYSRSDSDFVLKLAKELREAGVNIWLDQLDIKPGSHWDASIQNALQGSKKLLIILSPNSVASENVMDEVSFALEEGKTVIPILKEDCETPFRLRRLQRIDFTGNYQAGFANLLEAIGAKNEDKDAMIAKMADKIHTATAHSKTATIAPIEKSKPKTKLFLLAGGVVALIAVIVLLLTKKGSGDDKDNLQQVTSQTHTEVPAVIIDTSMFYFIMNRDNSKILGVENGSFDTEAAIGLYDTIGKMNKDYQKFRLIKQTDENNDAFYYLIAKHSGKVISFSDQLYLIQYKTLDELLSEPRNAEWDVPTCEFNNLAEGYFSIKTSTITSPVKYAVLEYNADEFNKEGTSVYLTDWAFEVPNAKAKSRQWKLISAGEKIN